MAITFWVISGVAVGVEWVSSFNTLIIDLFVVRILLEFDYEDEA